VIAVLCTPVGGGKVKNTIAYTPYLTYSKQLRHYYKWCSLTCLWFVQAESWHKNLGFSSKILDVLYSLKQHSIVTVFMSKWWLLSWIIFSLSSWSEYCAACGNSYFAFSFDSNWKSFIEITDWIMKILFLGCYCCCLNCCSAECGDSRELNKKSFDKLMNSVSNLNMNYVYLFQCILAFVVCKCSVIVVYRENIAIWFVVLSWNVRY